MASAGSRETALAEVAAHLGRRDRKRAIGALRAFLAYPDGEAPSGLHYLLGTLLLEDGNQVQAVKAFRRAAEVDPDDGNRRLTADIAGAAGQGDKQALAALIERGLEASDDTMRPDVWGRLLMAAGHHGLAIRCLTAPCIESETFADLVPLVLEAGGADDEALEALIGALPRLALVVATPDRAFDGLIGHLYERGRFSVLDTFLAKLAAYFPAPRFEALRVYLNEIAGIGPEIADTPLIGDLLIQGHERYYRACFAALLQGHPPPEIEVVSFAYPGSAESAAPSERVRYDHRRGLIEPESANQAPFEALRRQIEAQRFIIETLQTQLKTLERRLTRSNPTGSDGI